MSINFFTLFEEYWNQYERLTVRDNPERTFQNIVKKLEQCQSIADVDEYVIGLKSARESTRRIIVKFYNYLQNKGIPVESVLPEKTFFDYPFQRQLEIAKFLHEEHTNQEIMDQFDIDSRTVRKDLQALRDGIEVLGANIRIHETISKGGRKQYKTTVHPIFLPLNLTEVYALTTYLDTLMKDDPNSAVIHSVTNRIRGQLSDYAYHRLFPDSPGIAENRYIDDQKLAESREGIVAYLMKSGETCSFWMNNQIYKGHFIFGKDGYQIKLEDEVGTRIDYDPEKIEFIVGELKYK